MEGRNEETINEGKVEGLEETKEHSGIGNK